eukprot:NODE_671_length_4854_cov_0.553312.p6 type:complete len:162 gc:universal NODE_671_length_4854_cov_0.553312:3951-4436(+)
MRWNIFATRWISTSLICSASGGNIIGRTLDSWRDIFAAGRLNRSTGRRNIFCRRRNSWGDIFVDCRSFSDRLRRLTSLSLGTTTSTPVIVIISRFNLWIFHRSTSDIRITSLIFFLLQFFNFLFRFFDITLDFRKFLETGLTLILFESIQFDLIFLDFFLF